MQVTKNRFLTSRKLAYITIPVVILVVIGFELPVIGNYHSSTGFEEISPQAVNQSIFLVISKLPGVAVNMQLLFNPDYVNPVAISLPANSTAGYVTTNTINVSNSNTVLTVHFNLTSASLTAVHTSIDNLTSIDLTRGSPVSVTILQGNHPESMRPEIVVTHNYDYIVIQAASIASVYYSEVSR